MLKAKTKLQHALSVSDAAKSPRPESAHYKCHGGGNALSSRTWGSLFIGQSQERAKKSLASWRCSAQCQASWVELGKPSTLLISNLAKKALPSTCLMGGILAEGGCLIFLVFLAT
jgi:hypothetical protein